MLGPLRLLLPALAPSWNFFDVIAPSPRIEYALSATEADERLEWREFRPRPEKVGPGHMLARLAFNARWNETLFVVSCAERLVDHPTDHSQTEILSRIARDLARFQPDALAGRWLRFRLVFIRRDQDILVSEIRFVSAPVRPLEARSS